jgi:phage FluMu gp28-like protein
MWASGCVEGVEYLKQCQHPLYVGVDFEDRTLRIDADSKLRDDLRAIKKCVTTAGDIRFVGESGDSHCDRFWGKALRHQAITNKKGMVGACMVHDGWEPSGGDTWSSGYASTAGIIEGLSRFSR